MEQRTPNFSSFPMCLCQRVKGKKGWVVSLPRDNEGGNRGRKPGFPKIRTPGWKGELFLD